MNDSYQGIEIFIQILTFLGAVIIFFRGYEEYRKSNRTKRAEFLERLIQEFDSDKIKNAKLILDDFLVPPYSKRNEKKWGSISQMPCRNLIHTLRNHSIPGNKIDEQEEMNVRECIDHFLTFLTKISYYYKNELITKDELYYFEYYIKKMEHPRVKAAFKLFIETYYVPCDFVRIGLNIGLSTKNCV